MTTDFSGIKQTLDLPVWEPLGIIFTGAGASTSAGAGVNMTCDLRLSQYRYQNIWYLAGTTVALQHNCRTNGWLTLASPALAGTFGAGASSVFAPSHGPRGTLAAGGTTTTMTLATALPNSASVTHNQLKGFRIRIIGSVGGGSGKTEERTIVSNSAGTTPTITLDSALSFTPVAGSAFEMLSGRVYFMSAGTVAAGIIKAFDIATSTYNTTALATTNLPATIGTDSAFVSMDELHTPITGVGGATVNGEVGGFFGTLTATASGATSLTGQAASGDASVLANEYRNFQIRIVEDTATPTAVGQRRRITSHTAGVSPVYTVPTWTVTPSATAKFVIENNNDIILWTTANTTTYRYEWVGNTWDTTTYAARPAASGAGVCAWHPFNRTIDTAKNVRHSFIYSTRGSNSVAIDLFDIAGAATGSWTGDIPYDNKGFTVWSTGGSAVYDPVSNKTYSMPVSVNNVPPKMYVFDNETQSLMSFADVPQVSGGPNVGEKLALSIYVDGNDRKSFVYHAPSSQLVFLRTLAFI